jgi:DNA-binding transcriptional regulator YiaG
MINDEKIIKRFTDKIRINEETGCWEWTAGRHKDDYGRFSLNGKQERAHRAAWIIFIGDIPSKLKVCHHCDNPKCVNFSHMFTGTHRDNMIDKVNKGRQSKGETHGNSKLTEEQVLEIKELLTATNLSERRIAKQYNISRATVRDIKHGLTWTHLNPTTNQPSIINDGKNNITS